MLICESDMPKLNLKVTNCELTPSLRSYVTDRIDSLAKFIDKSDGSVLFDVEIGKETRHHRHGEFYRAEINLRLAGKELRAEAQSEDLYASIDKARDEIIAVINSHRGRKVSLLRRGARGWKAFWRGGGRINN